MNDFLQRFLDAQAPVYERVVEELTAGRKTSHWMWFIFPQLRGLGRSSTAHFYGLPDLTTAHAYAEHPLLGARLRESCQLLLRHKQRPIGTILGTPDDLKLASCMTLFTHTQSTHSAAEAILTTFYGGRRDPLTEQLLSAMTQQERPAG